MSSVRDLSEYFSVAEAAKELDLSAARVRALVDSRVLTADKFAGRWLIPRESVQARKNNQRRGGRPLTSRNVWDLIHSGFIAQLLIDASKAAQHNIRLQLAERAEICDVYVLSHFVGRIRPIVMPGGRVLAESASVPAGRDPRWELDGYVHRDTLTALRNSKQISGVKGQPNVRLRVVDDGIEWQDSRAVRLLVAWLDLADDGDRAADMTLNALRSELRQAGVEPFPVGNNVVSRVSLGLLAAINDELSRGRV